MPSPWARDLVGDTSTWYADDPDRVCYSCGSPPTFRYSDGSPGYGCGPHAPVLGRTPVTLAEAGVRLEWTLDTRDTGTVERCVERILERSRARALRDRWGVRQEASNRRGYGGEMAFARIVGLPFRCSLEAFGKPDVGRYQVRTSSGHPHLVVHENDGQDVPVVLMIGRDLPGPFRLAGWLPQARDGKRLEYVRDPGGRRPAFFVPLAALSSPLTLPEIVAGASL